MMVLQWLKKLQLYFLAFMCKNMTTQLQGLLFVFNWLCLHLLITCETSQIIQALGWFDRKKYMHM
jgi:hypothetical protein